MQKMIKDQETTTADKKNSSSWYPGLGVGKYDLEKM